MLVLSTFSSVFGRSKIDIQAITYKQEITCNNHSHGDAGINNTIVCVIIAFVQHINKQES